MVKFCMNFVGGVEVEAKSGQKLQKKNPATGQDLFSFSRSNSADVENAVRIAAQAQVAWGKTPAVKRGEILFSIADVLTAHTNDLAEIIHLETGKSMKDAKGEVGAAVAQCRFMAGEGQRLFGRTTTSGVPGRHPTIIREPLGVVGLIAAANTPIANVAWKVFPALICGNATVMKPSEDAPLIATKMAKFMVAAGLPAGVFNVVHGVGEEAGAALVNNPDVALISFTGSTHVGKSIAESVGRRMGRVSLELGGKNPLVVFEDADLDRAVQWSALSAFSNAGQRCAAASRILVQESIFEKFKTKLVAKTRELKVGSSDTDDFGPVINSRQLSQMLESVNSAQKNGAKILCGGKQLDIPGYFMEPTILTNIDRDSELAQKEIFGPITTLFSFSDFEDAVALANSTSYGLTAAVHTNNYEQALAFSYRVQSGLVQINAGTYGSEPHMPFGGVKLSGNGTREPGPEALDVYSNLKTIVHNFTL